MRRTLKHLLIVSLAIFIASCSSQSPGNVPPPSFTRYQPIYLNVSNIEFVEEYKPPQRLPNVEHLMPYSPGDAVHIWVKDRLRAVGADKTLQVIIKDGSVTVTQLSVPGGIEGWFTASLDRRYDAKLDVELRIYGTGSAMSEANVHVTAHRSITLNENASVAERDTAFRRLIADLMVPVDAELEKNIFQYMGNHINFSQNP